MRLPLKLADLRKEAGLTQIELAEKLEVSRQAISKWEVGTAVPGIYSLKALSELYGVSIDYLLNDALDRPAGDPVQASNDPVADDGKISSKKFLRGLLAALAIVMILSAAFCLAAAPFKEENRPVPMENMRTDKGICPDETFSIG